MGGMARERDVSNAEIIWFLTNFQEDVAGSRFNPATMRSFGQKNGWKKRTWEVIVRVELLK